MTTSVSSIQACGAFELRFHSLFDEGRGYSFPCDAMGHVDLDVLSERAQQLLLRSQRDRARRRVACGAALRTSLSIVSGLCRTESVPPGRAGLLVVL